MPFTILPVVQEDHDCGLVKCLSKQSFNTETFQLSSFEQDEPAFPLLTEGMTDHQKVVMLFASVEKRI
jgi:hypothetical protein